MAYPVIMPKQGQSVESCVITRWNKKVGDPVQKGELLFSYETDKAVFEFEAPDAGILLAVFFPEDSEVPVLTNVGVIGKDGEPVDSFRPAVTAAVEKSETVRPDFMEKVEAIRSDGTNVSPRARSLAEKREISLLGITGSGPDGRIIERDVQAAIGTGRSYTRAAALRIREGKTAPAEGTGIGGRIRSADLAAAEAVSEPALEGTTVIPFSNIRKRIAERMLASLQRSAQLTLHTSADASSLLSYRGKVKKSLKKERRNGPQADVNVNDMVVFVVSRVLLRHPQINAVIEGDRLITYSRAHVGVAIDTEKGLMVPTLFQADGMSLDEISVTIRRLAEACRNQTLSPDLLQGGSFTVTNLGPLGIESFTPVLNYPQVGILGVNAIVDRCRRDVAGNCRPVPFIGLSLTFDHRALDGAPAARFLADIRGDLENFESVLTGATGEKNG
jgi:pyruvate dehydrogenase E2 component (dihydrolipoamide acetyltransferase)